MSRTTKKDVTKELLARVGEAAVMKELSNRGIKVVDFIPGISVVKDTEEDQYIVTIHDIDEDPRRLVLVPGVGWSWYNSEGTEE